MLLCVHTPEQHTGMVRGSLISHTRSGFPRAGLEKCAVFDPVSQVEKCAILTPPGQNVLIRLY